MIDVIIPVYRPDDKLERLVEKLAVQTIQPTHVYFMQTLVDEKEDERVKNILERLPNGQIVPIEKKKKIMVPIKVLCLDIKSKTATKL